MPEELFVFVCIEYHRHLPRALPTEITTKGQAAKEPETEKAWSALIRPIFEGKTVMVPLTD